MLIPDVNILVYAYARSSPRHKPAREWWETTLQQPRPVGLPWPTIVGFIRVMTQRGNLFRPHAGDGGHRPRS